MNLQDLFKQKGRKKDRSGGRSARSDHSKNTPKGFLPLGGLFGHGGTINQSLSVRLPQEERTGY